nr:hypothetical protein [Streptomyces sabulosicollis]
MEAEAGEPQRLAGQPRQRAHDRVGEHLRVGRQGPEQPPPGVAVRAEPVRRPPDRPVQRARAAGIQRVREIDLGPQPLQPVRLQVQ